MTLQAETIIYIRRNGTTKYTNHTKGKRREGKVRPLTLFVYSVYSVVQLRKKPSETTRVSVQEVLDPYRITRKGTEKGRGEEEGGQDFPG